MFVPHLMDEKGYDCNGKEVQESPMGFKATLFRLFDPPAGAEPSMPGLAQQNEALRKQLAELAFQAQDLREKVVQLEAKNAAWVCNSCEQTTDPAQSAAPSWVTSAKIYDFARTMEASYPERPPTPPPPPCRPVSSPDVSEVEARRRKRAAMDALWYSVATAKEDENAMEIEDQSWRALCKEFPALIQRPNNDPFVCSTQDSGTYVCSTRDSGKAQFEKGPTRPQQPPVHDISARTPGDKAYFNVESKSPKSSQDHDRSARSPGEESCLDVKPRELESLSSRSESPGPCKRSDDRLCVHTELQTAPTTLVAEQLDYDMATKHVKSTKVAAAQTALLAKTKDFQQTLSVDSCVGMSAQRETTDLVEITPSEKKQNKKDKKDKKEKKEKKDKKGKKQSSSPKARSEAVEAQDKSHSDLETAPGAAYGHTIVNTIGGLANSNIQSGIALAASENVNRGQPGVCSESTAQAWPSPARSVADATPERQMVSVSSIQGSAGSFDNRQALAASPNSPGDRRARGYKNRAMTAETMTAHDDTCEFSAQGTSNRTMTPTTNTETMTAHDGDTCDRRAKGYRNCAMPAETMKAHDNTCDRRAQCHGSSNLTMTPTATSQTMTAHDGDTSNHRALGSSNRTINSTSAEAMAPRDDSCKSDAVGYKNHAKSPTTEATTPHGGDSSDRRAKGYRNRGVNPAATAVMTAHDSDTMQAEPQSLNSSFTTPKSSEQVKVKEHQERRREKLDDHTGTTSPVKLQTPVEKASEEQPLSKEEWKAARKATKQKQREEKLITEEPREENASSFPNESNSMEGTWDTYKYLCEQESSQPTRQRTKKSQEHDKPAKRGSLDQKNQSSQNEKDEDWGIGAWFGWS